MKTIAVALLFFTAMTTQAKPIAIVIHAGAGRIDRDSFTPERERLYHVTLEQSLRAGHAILKGGGSGGIIGLDAQGNVVMEFNTNAMTRGSIGPDGILKTAIFK